MITTRRLLFCTVAVMLNGASGCGSHNKAQQPGETADSKLSLTPDTLCFQQLMGRDSVNLKLFTKGTHITGYLTLRPYQKDRAQGPLVGIRTNNAITADWERSGEGVTQIYGLDLMLTADSVRWRDGERVSKNGKWVLKTPTEAVQYKLAKTDCR